MRRTSAKVVQPALSPLKVFFFSGFGVEYVGIRGGWHVGDSV